MILVYNIFIGPETRWFSYDRGPYSTPPKSQVAIATLGSYLQIGLTHAFVNIESDATPLMKKLCRNMCEMYLGDRFTFSETQAKTQAEWKQLYKQIAEVSDGPEPIWLACNHDHPIIDYTMVESIKQLFKDRQDPLMSVIYSHWSEFLDQALIHDHELHPEGFVSYPCQDVHSVRVITPYLFRAWWHDHDYGDLELPRPDWWIGGGPWDGGHIPVKSPQYKSFVPLMEVARHFDGYSHIGVPPESGQGCLILSGAETAVDPNHHRYTPVERANVVPSMNNRSIPESWYFY
jgi:hypothetical protein